MTAGSFGKESICNAGDLSSIPGLGRSPGEENGNPVFLLGHFHGQRNLMGYSPWDRKESDTIGQLTHTHTYTHMTEVLDKVTVSKEEVKDFKRESNGQYSV